MIKCLKGGDYQLIETKDQTKVLILDGQKTYAWVNAKGIGEILVNAKTFTRESILAAGKYRLYKVKDEPKLTDLEHLELFAGDGNWQGYLLTSGMPDKRINKKRIIPTDELITKSVL